MARSGRPELGIVIAIAGCLLAIGVPAVEHASALVGWACIGGAVLALLWLSLTLWRARG